MANQSVLWGTGRKEFFRGWAKYEIDRALGQRAPLERDWQRYLQAYRVPPERGESHFPFVGAHNYTYPLVPMNVDPIVARYVANIHAPENIWTCAALNERWMRTAKPLQDYLTFLDQRVIRMWDTNMRVIPEAVLLGTGIYKSYYRFEQRRTMGYGASRQRERVIKTINRPAVEHVLLSNFLTPPEAREVDPDAAGGAVWCAERHFLRPAQLRALASSSPLAPAMDAEAVKKVLDYNVQTLPPMEEKIMELDKTGTSLGMQVEKPIEVWELHARFDASGDGLEDDLVVLFHRETATVLRGTYEPFPRRPYYPIRYLRGPGFMGIGVGEQGFTLQEIVSDVLNFNLDKLLLTNSPMLGVREGANIVADEPIFPGKIWMLQDPSKDLLPFFLTANSSFDMNTMLGFLQEVGKQRTGITDLQHGTVGALPSRTPATTVQSLLQEGNTRFDMSMKDVRMALGDVGLSVLQNLQTQADSVGLDYVQLAPIILGSPEGEAVAQALQIPTEAIELGVGVTLTATSGLNNKEMQKQNSLALLQLVQQLAPGFIQLAQVIAAEGTATPTGLTAAQLFKSGAQYLQGALEQFDVRNTDELVPSLDALLAAQQSMAAQAGGQPPLALGGGGGSPASPSGSPGMASLS